MHSRAPTPSETSPLISSRHDHQPGDGLERPISDLPDPEVFRVSRMDLFWILAGLWSAVFLGALDGKYLGFCTPICATRSVGTIAATLMTPIGNYFNKSNQASYIGTSYLLSVCCFTPLYGAYTPIDPHIFEPARILDL